MDQRSRHRLRGNRKALSAALGVGVLITMGALTLAHPTSAVGTSSDSWKADTAVTLIPATRTQPSLDRSTSSTRATGPHRTYNSTTTASWARPLRVEMPAYGK